MSLAESYTAAFGNFIGRLLFGLTAIWTLLALARTASGAAAAFPEGDGAGMAPAVLMALTAWVCIRGENAPARCAAVLAPLLAGVYLILLAGREDGMVRALGRKPRYSGGRERNASADGGAVPAGRRGW